MSRATRVEAVIRSACRRRFIVVAVEQLALALALVFGGTILMLLLGTQILSWYWLALLGAAGLVFTGVRIRAQLVPPYGVAQLVDRRLHLSDALSTAWFLLSNADNWNREAGRFQLEHAEQLAASAVPRQAFPFRGQKTWALTGAVAAAAFGLFAVRYLVTNSLSLEHPLIPVQLGSVFERLEKSLSAENHSPDLKSSDPGAGDQLATQESNVPGDAIQPEELKAGKADGTGEGERANQKADSSASNDPKDGNSESRDGTPGANQASPGEKAENAEGNQSNSQQNPGAKEQASTTQQSSSGLMDKMKEALSSLMAKMRPSPGSQRSQDQDERLNQDQKSGDQSSTARDQKGQQNSRSDQTSQEQSAEGQAEGQTAEKAQASQGKSSDSSPQKGADAHSGIGRQDGDKDVKEAQQLEAMGKLAELIGKRSASVTGEMTIETSSGKQQLKTAYSQKLGRHSDLGGEINRDEIPLADQEYVKQYMEQVRKQSKTGQ